MKITSFTVSYERLLEEYARGARMIESPLIIVGVFTRGDDATFQVENWYVATFPLRETVIELASKERYLVMPLLIADARLARRTWSP